MNEAERADRREGWNERERLRERWNHAKRGFFCMLGLHATVGVVCLALTAAPFDELQMIPSLVLIGYPLVHFAWSLPLILFAGARGFTEFRKGALLAAGLATLAGCLCWGLICFSL